MICTGMWRVCGILFELLSTVQPSMSGRKTSSEIAVGVILARERERVHAVGGDQHLEALVMRKIEHHPRIMRIVLDDQRSRIAGLDEVRSSDTPPRGPLAARAIGRGAGAAPHRPRHCPQREAGPT